MRLVLDAHLVILYGVETRVLLQAVKRNFDRFPHDFMFQLTNNEFNDLRSHFVISSHWGGRRYAPYAFTEQSIAMLSSVLRSKQAVAINIEIMRAFIQLRRLMNNNEDFKRKIERLEKKYDKQFKIIFEAISQIMSPSISKSKRPIGFAEWKDN